MYIKKNDDQCEQELEIQVTGSSWNVNREKKLAHDQNNPCDV